MIRHMVTECSEASLEDWGIAIITRFCVEGESRQEQLLFWNLYNQVTEKARIGKAWHACGASLHCNRCSIGMRNTSNRPSDHGSEIGHSIKQQLLQTQQLPPLLVVVLRSRPCH